MLHNTDGELIELQRVVFDVDDAQRVLDALTRLPGFRCDEVERAEDGRLERAQLSWSKPGNRAQASWENTVLGHVAIETDRDENATMSPETAAKCGRGTGRNAEGTCVPLSVHDAGYVQRVQIPAGEFVMGFIPHEGYDASDAREQPAVRWSGNPPRTR